MREIEKKEAEQDKENEAVRERAEAKTEREKEKREKEETKKAKAMERKKKKQGTAGKDQTVEDLLAEMQISDEESSEDDDAVCPKCGLMYSADSEVWICCDGCDRGYDLKCTNIRGRRNIPDTFYCENCL